MCIRKSTYAGEGKGIKETRVTLEMCRFISLKKRIDQYVVFYIPTVNRV